MSESLQPDPAAGVFATLLVIAGEPIELDAHLARLGASARSLYGAELPAGAAELVAEHARELALGRLRLTAAPAPGGGRQVALDAVAQPVDRALVLPGWTYALDLRCVTVEDWRGEHKWADRRLLTQLDAQAAPSGALLVDPAKGVLETTRANVFAVGEDGVLRTPPADGSILPGITRGRLLEVARASGVDVREEPLTPRQVLAAREVFATGSVRGVEPVRTIDGVALRGPGRLTVALGDALKQRWFEPASERAAR